LVISKTLSVPLNSRLWISLVFGEYELLGSSLLVSGYLLETTGVYVGRILDF
jgi:hypothetical protein